MLPWKCHSGYVMKLCDECYNCTKFQFSTEYSIFCDFTNFFCPQYDVTNYLICINQNGTGNARNKINPLHHFERSFK